MKVNDLIKNIETNLASFSKGHRLIAQYIIKYYDKAAFMTANKLGSVVGVSESTVVRFAFEIGYNGYPHLQKHLQEIIQNKLTTVQRMEIAEDRIGNKCILHSVLSADMEKIRLTLDRIDKLSFEQSALCILNAKKIYILGVRSSSVLANFVGFYFNMIFENVQIINAHSDSEIIEQILHIGKDDVFIGISFPRYSQRTIEAMKYSKSNLASVIALTDSKTSPLAKYANYTLIAKSDMASFVDSLVAPLSVLNALIVRISLERQKELEQKFQNLEAIWNKYNVYDSLNED